MTVDRWQDRLRPLIEGEVNALITEGLSVARKSVVRLAKQAVDTDDKDWAKIGLDASKTILSAAGITGQPSTIINALIQVNQVPEQGATLQLLQEFLNARMQGTIDIGENIDKSIGNPIGENIDESLCENIDGNIDCTPNAQSHTSTVQPTLHPSVQLTIQPEVQPSVHQAEVEGTPGDFTDYEDDDDL